jgi:hypothetical protein
MHTRRGLVLLFAAVAAGSLFVFGPPIPRDQTVEVVLGAAAPKIAQIQLRYGPRRAGSTANDMDRDWTREVTFRYGQGVNAPRVVHHEPRLPDGDYVVEMDIAMRNQDDAGDQGSDKVRVTRNVRLAAGGSTSIDVAEAIPR